LLWAKSAHRHLTGGLNRTLYGGWIRSWRWDRCRDRAPFGGGDEPVDKLVLSMHDAQQVDERSAPELFVIVRELAQRAGLPMPRVYLMDSPQPNAFATGRNPRQNVRSARC
jgi:hypothetical protein